MEDESRGVSASHSPPVPGERGHIRYPPPDTDSFVFDATTGYRFDPTTGLHYDANSGFFINHELGILLHWDPKSNAYKKTGDFSGLGRPTPSAVRNITTSVLGHKPISGLSTMPVEDRKTRKPLSFKDDTETKRLSAAESYSSKRSTKDEDVADVRRHKRSHSPKARTRRIDGDDPRNKFTRDSSGRQREVVQKSRKPSRDGSMRRKSVSRERIQSRTTIREARRSRSRGSRRQQEGRGSQRSGLRESESPGGGRRRCRHARMKHGRSTRDRSHSQGDRRSHNLETRMSQGKELARSISCSLRHVKSEPRSRSSSIHRRDDSSDRIPHDRSHSGGTKRASDTQNQQEPSPKRNRLAHSSSNSQSEDETSATTAEMKKIRSLTNSTSCHDSPTTSHKYTNPDNKHLPETGAIKRRENLPGETPAVAAVEMDDGLKGETPKETPKVGVIETGNAPREEPLEVALIDDGDVLGHLFTNVNQSITNILLIAPVPLQNRSKSASDALKRQIGEPEGLLKVYINHESTSGSPCHFVVISFKSASAAKQWYDSLNGTIALCSEHSKLKGYIHFLKKGNWNCKHCKSFNFFMQYVCPKCYQAKDGGFSPVSISEEPTKWVGIAKLKGIFSTVESVTESLPPLHAYKISSTELMREPSGLPLGLCVFEVDSSEEGSRLHKFILQQGRNSVYTVMKEEPKTPDEVYLDLLFVKMSPTHILHAALVPLSTIADIQLELSLMEIYLRMLLKEDCVKYNEIALHVDKNVGAPYSYALITFADAETAAKWKKSRLKTFNRLTSSNQRSKVSLHFSEGDWKCQGCHVPNFSLRFLCHRCFKHKENRLGPISVSWTITSWVAVSELSNWSRSDEDIIADFRKLLKEFVFKRIDVVRDTKCHSLPLACVFEMHGKAESSRLKGYLESERKLPVFIIVHKPLNEDFIDLSTEPDVVIVDEPPPDCIDLTGEDNIPEGYAEFAGASNVMAPVGGRQPPALLGGPSTPTKDEPPTPWVPTDEQPPPLRMTLYVPFTNHGFWRCDCGYKNTSTRCICIKCYKQRGEDKAPVINSIYPTTFLKVILFNWCAPNELARIFSSPFSTLYELWSSYEVVKIWYLGDPLISTDQYGFYVFQTRTVNAANRLRVYCMMNSIVEATDFVVFVDPTAGSIIEVDSSFTPLVSYPIVTSDHDFNLISGHMMEKPFILGELRKMVCPDFETFFWTSLYEFHLNKHPLSNVVMISLCPGNREIPYEARAQIQTSLEKSGVECTSCKRIFYNYKRDVGSPFSYCLVVFDSPNMAKMWFDKCKGTFIFKVPNLDDEKVRPNFLNCFPQKSTSQSNASCLIRSNLHYFLPNWICSFCETANFPLRSSCHNCFVDRNKTSDYFRSKRPTSFVGIRLAEHFPNIDFSNLTGILRIMGYSISSVQMSIDRSLPRDPCGVIICTSKNKKGGIRLHKYLESLIKQPRRQSVKPPLNELMAVLNGSSGFTFMECRSVPCPPDYEWTPYQSGNWNTYFNNEIPTNIIAIYHHFLTESPPVLDVPIASFGGTIKRFKRGGGFTATFWLIFFPAVEQAIGWFTANHGVLRNNNNQLNLYFTLGIWTCARCSSPNFPARVLCHKCYTHRMNGYSPIQLSAVPTRWVGIASQHDRNSQYDQKKAFASLANVNFKFRSVRIVTDPVVCLDGPYVLVIEVSSPAEGLRFGSYLFKEHAVKSEFLKVRESPKSSIYIAPENLFSETSEIIPVGLERDNLVRPPVLPDSILGSKEKESRRPLTSHSITSAIHSNPKAASSGTCAALSMVCIESDSSAGNTLIISDDEIEEATTEQITPSGPSDTISESSTILSDPECKILETTAVDLEGDNSDRPLAVPDSFLGSTDNVDEGVRGSSITHGNTSVRDSGPTITSSGKCPAQEVLLTESNNFSENTLIISDDEVEEATAKQSTSSEPSGTRTESSTILSDPECLMSETTAVDLEGNNPNRPLAVPDSFLGSTDKVDEGDRGSSTTHGNTSVRDSGPTVTSSDKCPAREVLLIEGEHFSENTDNETEEASTEQSTPSGSITRRKSPVTPDRPQTAHTDEFQNISLACSVFQNVSPSLKNTNITSSHYQPQITTASPNQPRIATSEKFSSTRFANLFGKKKTENPANPNQLQISPAEQFGSVSFSTLFGDKKTEDHVNTIQSQTSPREEFGSSSDAALSRDKGTEDQVIPHLQIALTEESGSCRNSALLQNLEAKAADVPQTQMTHSENFKRLRSAAFFGGEVIEDPVIPNQSDPKGIFSSSGLDAVGNDKRVSHIVSVCPVPSPGINAQQFYSEWFSDHAPECESVKYCHGNSVGVSHNYCLVYFGSLESATKWYSTHCGRIKIINRSSPNIMVECFKTTNALMRFSGENWRCECQKENCSTRSICFMCYKPRNTCVSPFKISFVPTKWLGVKLDKWYASADILQMINKIRLTSYSVVQIRYFSDPKIVKDSFGICIFETVTPNRTIHLRDYCKNLSAVTYTCFVVLKDPAAGQMINLNVPDTSMISPIGPRKYPPVCSDAGDLIEDDHVELDGYEAVVCPDYETVVWLSSYEFRLNNPPSNVVMISPCPGDRELPDEARTQIQNSIKEAGVNQGNILFSFKGDVGSPFSYCLVHFDSIDSAKTWVDKCNGSFRFNVPCPKDGNSPITFRNCYMQKGTSEGKFSYSITSKLHYSSLDWLCSSCNKFYFPLRTICPHCFKNKNKESDYESVSKPAENSSDDVVWWCSTKFVGIKLTEYLENLNASALIVQKYKISKINICLDPAVPRDPCGVVIFELESVDEAIKFHQYLTVMAGQLSGRLKKILNSSSSEIIFLKCPKSLQSNCNLPENWDTVFKKEFITKIIIFPLDSSIPPKCDIPLEPYGGRMTKCKQFVGCLASFWLIHFPNKESAKEWYDANEGKLKNENHQPTLYFTEDLWVCQSCKAKNFPARVVCYACFKHKHKSISPIIRSDEPTRWIGIYNKNEQKRAIEILARTRFPLKSIRIFADPKVCYGGSYVLAFEFFSIQAGLNFGKNLRYAFFRVHESSESRSDGNLQSVVASGIYGTAEDSQRESADVVREPLSSPQDPIVPADKTMEIALQQDMSFGSPHNKSVSEGNVEMVDKYTEDAGYSNVSDEPKHDAEAEISSSARRALETSRMFSSKSFADMTGDKKTQVSVFTDQSRMSNSKSFADMAGAKKTRVSVFTDQFQNVPAVTFSGAFVAMFGDQTDDPVFTTDQSQNVPVVKFSRAFAALFGDQTKDPVPKNISKNDSPRYIISVCPAPWLGTSSQQFYAELFSNDGADCESVEYCQGPTFGVSYNYCLVDFVSQESATKWHNKHQGRLKIVHRDFPNIPVKLNNSIRFKPTNAFLRFVGENWRCNCGTENCPTRLICFNCYKHKSNETPPFEVSCVPTNRLGVKFNKWYPKCDLVSISANTLCLGSVKNVTFVGDPRKPKDPFGIYIFETHSLEASVSLRSYCQSSVVVQSSVFVTLKDRDVGAITGPKLPDTGSKIPENIDSDGGCPSDAANLLEESLDEVRSGNSEQDPLTDLEIVDPDVGAITGPKPPYTGVIAPENVDSDGGCTSEAEDLLEGSTPDLDRPGNSRQDTFVNLDMSVGTSKAKGGVGVSPILDDSKDRSVDSLGTSLEITQQEIVFTDRSEIEKKAEGRIETTDSTQASSKLRLVYQGKESHQLFKLKLEDGGVESIDQATSHSQVPERICLGAGDSPVLDLKYEMVVSADTSSEIPKQEIISTDSSESKKKSERGVESTKASDSQRDVYQGQESHQVLSLKLKDGSVESIKEATRASDSQRNVSQMLKLDKFFKLKSEGEGVDSTEEATQASESKRDVFKGLELDQFFKLKLEGWKEKGIILKPKK